MLKNHSHSMTISGNILKRRISVSTPGVSLMRFRQASLALCVLFLLILSIAFGGCTTNDNGGDEDFDIDDAYHSPDFDYGGLRILNSEGWVNASSGGVERLRFLVERHPPGPVGDLDIEPIDVEQELAIKFVWMDMEQRIEKGESGSTDLLHENNSAFTGIMQVDRFTYSILIDPDRTMEESGLLFQGSRIRLSISLNDIDRSWRNVNSIEDGLQPGSSGSAKFYFVSGCFPIIKDFMVPFYLPEEGGWVDLY